MRNENSNLRMIFTGSVGLHHVLADLRGDQYASQPTNDMEKVEIGALTFAFARILAKNFLIKEDIECDTEDRVVERLVKVTDGVPFYIHRVVTQMALLEEIATPATVDAIIKKQLTNASDPWEMEHFRNRLKIYYNGRLLDADKEVIETATVAKALLNNIAIASEPQSINQSNADLNSRMRFQNKDAVIQLLNSLAKDHYLTRDDDGRYQFRFPLVRRWWKLAEGLNE